LELSLRLLDPGDGCRSLKLGSPDLVVLKTFLQKEAKELHKRDLAKTFVLVEQDETRVWAYVTLLCTHVQVEDFRQPPDVDVRYRYRQYPALKLARLAVDSSLQGQHIGSALVDFALGLAVEQVMPHVGCRFLVLDAKPNSVSFYERKGFSHMGAVADGGQNLTAMFIDLHKLKAP